MDLVHHNMEFLNVPAPIQERVLKYYENMWRFHKSLGESTATTFIGELSRPLQIELKKVFKWEDMLPWDMLCPDWRLAGKCVFNPKLCLPHLSGGCKLGI